MVRPIIPAGAYGQRVSSALTVAARALGVSITGIEAYDRCGPALNAVVVFNPDVLAEARASDQRRSRAELLADLALTGKVAKPIGDPLTPQAKSARSRGRFFASLRGRLVECSSVCRFPQEAACRCVVCCNFTPHQLDRLGSSSTLACAIAIPVKVVLVFAGRRSQLG
jgi:hypothetical protein